MSCNTDLRRWLAGLIVGAFVGPGAAHAADANGYWQPKAEVGGSLGNSRSALFTELFTPLGQTSDSLFYSVIQGTFTDAPTQEGNFGLGHRRFGSVFGIEGIAGIYGFYDIRNSAAGNFFDQATLGAEWLSEHVELRANGYLPFDRTYTMSSGSTTAAQVSGNIIQGVTSTSATVETALPGFDVEGGVRFDAMPALGHKSPNVGLYGGYYHFEADGLRLAGPKARVELTWSDPFGVEGAKFALGGTWQQDDPRGSQAAGFARWRMPLGKARSAAIPADAVLYDRMTRRVIRDVDIVTTPSSSNTEGAPVNLVDGDSNQLNAYFVAQGGSGTACSQAAPCSLTTAQGMAGQGDLFVLLSSGGNITQTSALSLGTNQQVIGGGETGSAAITLSDPSTTMLALNGLGSRPTLDSGTNTIAGITAGNGNTISGIGVSGGFVGINGAPTGLKISDTQISGMSQTSGDVAFGVYLNGGSNVSVTDGTSVSNINPSSANETIYGFRFDNVAGVTIDDATVDGLTSTGDASNFNAIGIFAFQGSNISITDTTVQNLTADNGVAGMSFASVGGSGVQITDSTVQNLTGNNGGGASGTDKNRAYGMRFNGTGSYQVAGSTVDDIQSSNPNVAGTPQTGVGIAYVSGSGSLTVSDTDISNTSSFGLLSLTSSGDITVNQGSTFTNIGYSSNAPVGWFLDGIRIADQGSSTVTIQDSIFNNVAYFGLYAQQPGVSGGTVDYVVTGNQFSNIGTFGVAQGDDQYGVGLYFDPRSNTYRVLADDNVFTNVTDGVLLFARDTYTPNLQATVTNNDITTRAGSSGPDAVVVVSQTGSTCVNVDNNTLGSDKSIVLTHTGGTLSVEDLAGLSARNDAASIEPTGTVGSVASGTCVVPAN